MGRPSAEEGIGTRRRARAEIVVTTGRRRWQAGSGEVMAEVG